VIVTALWRYFRLKHNLNLPIVARGVNVTWAGEVTESNGPAGKVLRGTFNQGPDVLERGHRIARIGEPLRRRV
jgi:hypothetical protein